MFLVFAEVYGSGVFVEFSVSAVFLVFVKFSVFAMSMCLMSSVSADFLV